MKSFLIAAATRLNLSNFTVKRQRPPFKYFQTLSVETLRASR